MLEERAKRGEDVKQDSWLFRSYSKRMGDGYVRKVRMADEGEALSPSQVREIVKSAALRIGIQERYGKRYLYHPRGFRRYWKHQLRMGGVHTELLDYMMGHVLPYGGAYDRWTEEDIRREYKRAERYISLRPWAPSKEEIQTEVLRVMLGKLTDEDLRKISRTLGVPASRIRSMVGIPPEE
jgi:hypothetical protein